MLRAITIPDVEPTLPKGSAFSLVAGLTVVYLFSNMLLLTVRNSGDFEEIYGGESDPDEPQAGEWDAVMTCFFIDTVRGNS